MTTRPNETTRISTYDCDHNPQGSQPDQIIRTEAEQTLWDTLTLMNDRERIEYENTSTEHRLKDIRATMRYYRPSKTFGREHGRINGYYYTEPTDNGRV